MLLFDEISHGGSWLRNRLFGTQVGGWSISWKVDLRDLGRVPLTFYDALEASTLSPLWCASATRKRATPTPRRGSGDFPSSDAQLLVVEIPIFANCVGAKLDIPAIYLARGRAHDSTFPPRLMKCRDIHAIFSVHALARRCVMNQSAGYFMCLEGEVQQVAAE